MSPWATLSIAILAEVVGTSLLKQSDGFTRLAPSLAVVVAYVVSFYFLALTLRTMPVGVAYAVWSGVGIALIALIGFVFFAQSLDVPAMLGIGLILAGVVVINTFSSSVGQGGS